MNDNAEAMKKIGDELNGAGVIKGNPDVISLLQDLLKRAQAGEVAGIAISVAHGPEVVSVRAAGGFPATLVLGLEQVKTMLQDNVFSPKKQSGLLVPRRV